jgi:hypothetical protein
MMIGPVDKPISGQLNRSIDRRQRDLQALDRSRQSTFNEIVDVVRNISDDDDDDEDRFLR